jgi:hypothetical protein
MVARWDEKAGPSAGCVTLPMRIALEGAIEKETGHEKAYHCEDSIDRREEPAREAHDRVGLG